MFPKKTVEKSRDSIVFIFSYPLIFSLNFSKSEGASFLGQLLLSEFISAVS